MSEKKLDESYSVKLSFDEIDENGIHIRYYSNIILNLIKTFQKDYKFKKKIISEKTFLLISYGDNLKNKNEVPLKTLKNFFDKNLNTFFEILYVLPLGEERMYCYWGILYVLQLDMVPGMVLMKR